MSKMIRGSESIEALQRMRRGIEQKLGAAQAAETTAAARAEAAAAAKQAQANKK